MNKYYIVAIFIWYILLLTELIKRGGSRLYTIFFVGLSCDYNEIC